jgi:hypothetical protein
MKGFVDFVIHQFLFLVSDSIIAGTAVSILFDVLDTDVTQKEAAPGGLQNFVKLGR